MSLSGFSRDRTSRASAWSATASVCHEGLARVTTEVATSLNLPSARWAPGQPGCTLHSRAENVPLPAFCPAEAPNGFAGALSHWGVVCFTQSSSSDANLFGNHLLGPPVTRKMNHHVL